MRLSQALFTVVLLVGQPAAADTTASGLNSAGAGEGELNPYRISDDNVRVDHFGVVRYITDSSPAVELTLYNADGDVLQQYLVDYASWQLTRLSHPGTR
jgi:hypothetical protein